MIYSVFFDLLSKKYVYAQNSFVFLFSYKQIRMKRRAAKPDFIRIKDFVPHRQNFIQQT